MRKLILPIVILFLAVRCKPTQKPEFVRVDKVNVLHADLKTVELKADAVFLNPNRLGGTLKSENIDVFVDDVLIAKVTAEEFKVPGKDEFVVPLLINFDTSKLLDSNNLLGSLLKQFVNKKVIIRLKGELSYKVVGFSTTYPIDHTEELLIK